MHASQSSGASILRIAQYAAARGESVVLRIGPSRPPAQPAAAGPGPAVTGVHSDPQPSGPAHSQQEEVGDDPDGEGCADADEGEESVGQDVARGAVEDCPAEFSAEECPAGGGYEDSEHYSTSEQRTFANPLLRDHDPREQQLEMLIPPHAFPWVSQRILGGGHPQAALKRIAAFIDEMFMSEQQESCDALQMPSADEQPGTQCLSEPQLLSTTPPDETQHEPSAEQRT